MLPAFFLPLAALVSPDPAAPWELVEACPRLIVRGRGNSTATAVVIGQKDGIAYLLTADHAVADGTPTEVQFFTHRSYPTPTRVLKDVTVVKTFRQPDFALLKVRTGETPVPELKLAPPADRPRMVPFEAVSIGCTKGEAPTGKVETVLAKRFGRRGANEEAFFWETDKPPTPGRSGGPLIVGGWVVGICAAGKEGRGYYAHTDELLAGLKAAGYGWVWEQPDGK